MLMDLLRVFSRSIWYLNSYSLFREQSQYKSKSNDDFFVRPPVEEVGPSSYIFYCFPLTSISRFLKYLNIFFTGFIKTNHSFYWSAFKTLHG